MPDAKSRAKRIKLVLFDVDGVLTDGTIWLFPAPAGLEQPGVDQKIKAEARKHGTQYQRMIRRLLDAYAERHTTARRPRSTPRRARAVRIG